MPHSARSTSLPNPTIQRARQLVNYYVGQGVGLMNETVSARTVVYNFMEDFADAAERLQVAVGE